MILSRNYVKSSVQCCPLLAPFVLFCGLGAGEMGTLRFLWLERVRHAADHRHGGGERDYLRHPAA